MKTVSLQMKTRCKPEQTESFFFRPVSWFETLRWNEVFSPTGRPPETPCKTGFHAAATTPIHVDLGAGDGGFVRARARNHPETRFLAVDRLLGRARKIARGAFRDRLINVRVLRIEASYAVEHLFPPHSIASITVLFPDPWPKRRHHKNRLVQPSFLRHCARCLQSGGWIALKTDDVSYHRHIQQTLDGCEGFSPWPEAVPSVLLPEATDFEREFLNEGRPVYFVAARAR